MPDLHPSTWGYLAPNPDEIVVMGRLRDGAAAYAEIITTNLPDSADRTYVLRSLRSLAMWTNVAVTRHPDGTPRAAQRQESVEDEQLEEAGG